MAASTFLVQQIPDKVYYHLDQVTKLVEYYENEEVLLVHIPDTSNITSRSLCYRISGVHPSGRGSQEGMLEDSWKAQIDQTSSNPLEEISNTNEILLSDKVHWEEMMKSMIDEGKIETISSSEKVSRSQILRAFLLLKELPPKVSEVINLHKKKMQQIANDSGFEQWWKAMKTTQEASSEGKPEDDHPPTYYSDLVQETNEILLSEKGNWEAMMTEMLDKIKLDWSSIVQISLFRILRGFLTLEDLPPNFLGVIDSKLTRIETAAKMPLGMERLWDELKETRELIERAQERQSVSDLAVRSREPEVLGIQEHKYNNQALHYHEVPALTSKGIENQRRLKNPSTLHLPAEPYLCNEDSQRKSWTVSA
ncbi:uncharacterized protein MELLADRAFT_104126 [Melampsora larici-populina 98AG31]|uniref:Uncharacterized protein n=1 Tax=Melampsora larici-populina (strain 98AG31 / pathotype 3-4-7) TaxID=747676 RepID=F4RDN6_MELLP|nr:uncharacterized protein MELLADRAFT_104126 [Melampsora larici-populina 98AG31]EGG09574.1 hypothetical protein MELLADRAFT_104126 [Melampsora larici-populina 98AG31]